ncbi:MAG: hypothetical protein KKA07_06265 [Bacteroidetes bacterium]|nr:hypothetical protein [Bacteroidota bacterium]MBU1718659.1 hypothetical protein [Bacteroidota bacterium]
METRQHNVHFKDERGQMIANFLHLTNFDLDYSSRKKAFEEVTLNDFSYNYPYASEASFVFYVDVRPKVHWWKRLLGLMERREKTIKQLKP